MHAGARLELRRGLALLKCQRRDAQGDRPDRAKVMLVSSCPASVSGKSLSFRGPDLSAPLGCATGLGTRRPLGANRNVKLSREPRACLGGGIKMVSMRPVTRGGHMTV